VLDVLPIILRDGGPPGTFGCEISPDLRVVAKTYRFIPGYRRALCGLYLGTATIKHSSQSLGVGEGVMDAGAVAVMEIVWPAIKQAILRAGGHQFEVAESDLVKTWVMIGQQDVRGMTAIAGSTAPPAPLVVAGAPAIVPGPVGQHELHVSTKRFNGLFEHLLIVCKQGILGKRGERFFNVVTEINRMAAFWSDITQRMTLTEEQAVGGEVVETRVG